MQSFKKTPDQVKATQLLAGPCKWIMLHGGSRSGKTLILIRAMCIRAIKAAGSRHIIFRFRFNHVKQSIFMETLPKVLQVCFPEVPVKWNREDYFITFPNGSEIWISGLDDKDRVEKVLGKEYTTIYFNESSQIPYHSVSMAETRLAQKTELVNKVYFDCNPPTKTHWLYAYFFLKINPETKVPHPKPELYAEMQMNPDGNAENLPDDYIETVLGSLSERKMRRFKNGEWLDDNPNALWSHDLIENQRVTVAPTLIRIVTGVDPAVTSGESSADTGIVTAGVDAAGHYYVLGDNSSHGSPHTWGTEVIKAYHKHQGDRIIGEVNNGGDLVEANLRSIDRNIPYTGVRATRGKAIRAEPIAALYEQGKVHHVGIFPELEDQMCSWQPGEKSPDRMDALVWALWELGGSEYGADTVDEPTAGDYVDEGGWL
ncbi:phage terminase large subunit [Methanospirillum stamsii]|uniref:DNA-packaging protein n=1 Tax=Methanospirillum stamsii TaxID=1277351 RepID=A0A2V2N4R9_9EURY|nr:phage terminase large subunit [Methanospirillum stamsii]PWR74819.1 DNA-packaging protein [Methanospirillum stamsii]